MCALIPGLGMGTKLDHLSMRWVLIGVPFCLFHKTQCKLVYLFVNQV